MDIYMIHKYIEPTVFPILIIKYLSDLSTRKRIQQLYEIIQYEIQVKIMIFFQLASTPPLIAIPTSMKITYLT